LKNYYVVFKESDEKNDIKNPIHLAAAVMGKKHITTGSFSERGPGWLSNFFHWLKSLPSRHAEHDALEKMFRSFMKKGCRLSDLCALFRDVVVYSVAIDKNGEWRNAKPCRSCARLMHMIGINHCIYSTMTGFMTISIADLVLEAVDSRGALIPLIWKNEALLKEASVSNAPLFSLYIRNEDTFDLIQAKRKTIEVRMWSGEMRKRKRNEVIRVVYRNQKTCFAQISAIKCYKTFHKMLCKNDYRHVMPHAASKEDVLRKYHDIYPSHKRKKYDVVILCLRVMDLPTTKTNAK
jgi:ASC-1-like (ASCH) protein